MAEKQPPTITRDQARAALAVISASMKPVYAAIDAAPHAVARAAVSAIKDIEESVACELGLEILDTCEGCQTTIFEGDDHIVCRDGPYLCTECRPSDADLERMRAIQAACPKGDPECGAQTEDDDHGFCWGPEERTEAVPATAHDESGSAQ